MEEVEKQRGDGGEHSEVTAKPPTSPSLPLKTRITIAVISTVTDAARRHNGTVNRCLLNLIDFKAPPNSKPINGVKTSDFTVDSSRNLWFRVFVPTQRPPTSSGDLPVIVFFHGGGFTFLSADAKAYDAVCRRFAFKIPAVVVSVNYRLSPEHRYPAQYDDGFDVLKFLNDSDKKPLVLPENADISRCFLAGDSAGGNIAHHVAKRASEYKFRKLKVIGLMAIQPFFGGEKRTESERVIGSSGYLVTPERTDWHWKMFLPAGEGDRDHEAINVSGPRKADISRLVEFPATVVVVAEFDPLKDWQREYFKWLKASGKEASLLEYPGMIHAFHIFPELPDSDRLISELSDFVHKKSSSSSSSST